MSDPVGPLGRPPAPQPVRADAPANQTAQPAPLADASGGGDVIDHAPKPKDGLLKSAYNFLLGDDLDNAFGKDKSLGQRALGVGMLAMNIVPVGKVAGLVEKVGAKAVEAATEHAVAEGAEHAATAAAKGSLTIAAGRTLDEGEKAAAERLVASGNHVEALDVARDVNGKKIDGVPNPDFKVDGVVTELKTVSNLTTKDLSAGVARVIYDAGRQAGNVVVDVSKQPGITKEIAERAVRRAIGNDEKRVVEGVREAGRLNEVRVLGDGFDFSIKAK